MRPLSWITSGLGLLACVCCLSGYRALADRLTENPPNLLLTLIEKSNSDLGSEDGYLKMVSRQLTMATTELQQVQAMSSRLQSEITREQQQVIPIVQFQYEHGTSPMLWLSLLFSTADWQSFQSGYADLMEILQNRERVLQQYEHDVARYTALQNDALSALQDLQLAQANIEAEKQMYALARRQVKPEVGNPLLMNSLAALVQNAWNESIAPEVQNTLAQLDVTLTNLPQTLPKSDVQLSLTHAQVNIPQSILNGVIQQNPALHNVQFLFRQDHLILSAHAGNDMILTVGHLAVEENKRRADYVIDQVAVDGILVSAQSAQRWLQAYGFYIDVSRLSSHLRIRSLSVENQVLRLSLDVNI